MRNHFQPISQHQFTRSRRQIYMSSIGRLMDRYISCHVDRDHKRVVYQKKQRNLIKILNNLVVKVQRNVFQQLLKLTNYKRKQNNQTVFLPQALLKNDTQIMKNFRQKLTVGQIDRYISLHIPKNRSQSVRLEKSSIFQQNTIKTRRQQRTQKDIDSTYMYNPNQRSYGSKSIQVIKLKQHKNKKTGTKIMQFNISSILKDKQTINNSQGQLTKSNTKCKKKRDIIHITYTQYCLTSDNKKQNNVSYEKFKTSTKQNSSIRNKSKSKRISQFNINDEFSLQQQVLHNKQQQKIAHTVQCQSFFSTSQNVLKQLKQTQSPYIGKNRNKNSHTVNNFSYYDKQFQSIDIDEYL